MTVHFVELADPCKRCGGRMAELVGRVLGTPRCHYCGSLADLPFIDRIALWTDSLGRLFARGTAFSQTGRQDPTQRSLADQLRGAMNDLSQLYVGSARNLLQTLPSDLAGDEDELIQASAVLGRGLLIKLLAGALEQGAHQPALANLVMQQLGAEPWSQRDGSRDMGRLLALAPDVDWRMVLRPFAQLPSFRRRATELLTHVSRIVNLVIKFDGVVTDQELEHQQALHAELKDHIARFPRLPPPTHRQHPDRSVLDQLREDGAWLGQQLGTLSPASEGHRAGDSLDAALGDLDALVGIDLVKRDVRGLVDVLRLRAERRKLGLPEAGLRFHVAFLGNEGTGQGTVAAILGRICAALGELERGHLAETSGEALRSGHADLDERFDAARGGVLLVHHAHLVSNPAAGAAQQHDLWPRLLEHAERERDKLVLILSDERLAMERLLDTKTVSERFRRLEFHDYSVVELGRVLEQMARQNRYRLSRRARLEVLNGLSYRVRRDGALLGNARALRTVFEQAVERQAQRLARTPALSGAALLLMDAEDITLPGVPSEVRTKIPASLRTECPRCGRGGRFPAALLGDRIQCRACRHEMFADWGIPADS